MRVAAKRTPVTYPEVVEGLRNAWGRVFGGKPKPESLYVLAAQWALETARGKSMYNFNCAGIKAGSEQLHTYYPTTEVVTRAAAERFMKNQTPNARVEVAKDEGDLTVTLRFFPDNEICRFRAYETLNDGCFDYLLLLQRRFALSWDPVVAGDPAEFSRALKRQGYYTADEPKYTALMVSLFKEAQKAAPVEPVPDTLPTGKLPWSTSTEGIVEAELAKRGSE